MSLQPSEMLKEYIEKRNFDKTSEPEAVLNSDKSGDYMIHLHDARKKHYDLRLQWKGVLKCWAIPKGPSYDSNDKRLAVRTEDHPDEYKSFEGMIPEDSYGAGPSLIWDAGAFIPLEDFEEGMEKGRVKVLIQGIKLQGIWNLIHMKGKGTKSNWLFIKEKDEYENPGIDISDWNQSVATGQTLEDLREQFGAKPSKPKINIPKDTNKKAPAKIAPQLAVLKQEVPQGNWIYERKYDGYRIIAKVEDSRVRLYTRNGKDWTSKFPTIKEALENLPHSNIILDGEIVHFDEDGQTNFSKLQRFQDEAEDLKLAFVAFDILSFEGEALQSTPLKDRRKLLEHILEDTDEDSVIQISEVLEKSDNLLESACENKWEGIIAKEKESSYHSSRHRSWVKVKCSNRREFVVVGVTQPKGSRSHFGSILIAEPRPGGLIYRGKVGTGFTESELAKLNKLFAKKNQSSAPEIKGLDDEDVKSWLIPHFYAEVAYTEVTSDGRLRHPVFHGLRKDKYYKEEHLKDNEHSDGTQIKFTHADKVLFKEMGVTKAGLWSYYEEVFDSFLKWNQKHPLTLVRCPQGSNKQCFFQKHFSSDVPHPQTFEIKEKDKKDIYAFIDSKADLKALVQLGVLEFHLWNSKADDLESPLYVVFDLDPGPGIEFSDIIDSAKIVRKTLKKFKKESYVRTSGGKGLHVLCSTLGMSWEDSYSFSKSIAELLVEENPDLFVATSSKKRRKNKIFVDYLRNSRGATSVANYSTRAKKEPFVATPLKWNELRKGLTPDKFTIESVPLRLQRLKADPWQEFYDELFAN